MAFIKNTRNVREVYFFLIIVLQKGSWIGGNILWRKGSIPDKLNQIEYNRSLNNCDSRFHQIFRRRMLSIQYRSFVYKINCYHWKLFGDSNEKEKLLLFSFSLDIYRFPSYFFVFFHFFFNCNQTGGSNGNLLCGVTMAMLFGSCLGLYWHALVIVYSSILIPENLTISNQNSPIFEIFLLS